MICAYVSIRLVLSSSAADATIASKWNYQAPFLVCLDATGHVGDDNAHLLRLAA